MRRITLWLLALLWMTGTALALEAVGTVKRIDRERHIIDVVANGQDHVVPLAANVAVFGDDGQPLADGLDAARLKEGVEITVTVNRGPQGPTVQSIRLGRHAAVHPRQQGDDRGQGGEGKPSVGLKPLTEMTAQDTYKGEDGGLYGGGTNAPPPSLLAAAKKATARIVPLDADGKPAPQGKIGLVSISMSNATMEYSAFKTIADRDPAKSPQVAIIDCAQGGQAMAQWVDPNARPWAEAERRLEAAQVSPAQVQVVWVKLANMRPTGELAEHGRQLENDTIAVLQNAKAKFPNLRIAYLGSRIYAGYAATPLNPEPYAYEGAFAVRWLIQDQGKGNADLAFDDSNGTAKAPLLLWGPYFWGDGVTPRKRDGLVWQRADLAGDGTHPSESGRQKVAEMLLAFFKSDPLASTWFLKP